MCKEYNIRDFLKVGAIFVSGFVSERTGLTGLPKRNKNNRQSTKTKQSRVSFFTNNTKLILLKYLNFFDNSCNLSRLFPQRWIERKFTDAPIKVKQLRKYFSQEWDRRGGPTSIKKILMGHSLKGDVDLMHYNCQSEDDLKKIYDKFMN